MDAHNFAELLTHLLDREKIRGGPSDLRIIVSDADCNVAELNYSPGPGWMWDEDADWKKLGERRVSPVRRWKR